MEVYHVGLDVHKENIMPAYRICRLKKYMTPP
jgi:hypothetical protein